MIELTPAQSESELVQEQEVGTNDVEMQEMAERKHMAGGSAKVLERQQYRLVGNHSAVKVCGWTKNLLKGQGGCYKLLFYGIRSHQCMQMTTSMFCASRCTFCWRGAKAPVSKDWYGPVDDPEKIIDESLAAHEKLLVGYKGNDKVNAKVFEQSQSVRHVALSLTGEPITYPLIKEICDAFHKRKISTFIVTNAQFPEQMRKVDYCTQLYLSIDAPTKDLLQKIDRPLFDDFYERTMEALDVLREKPYRTCIRLTMIKDVNDMLAEKYAELIRRGEPNFIEVKGYMHVGASRSFLEQKNMPYVEDIEAFTQKLLEYLPEYEYVNTHKPSRVICLIRKDMNGHNHIDYPKFFEICENKDNPIAMNYSAVGMQPNK